MTAALTAWAQRQLNPLGMTVEDARDNHRGGMNHPDRRYATPPAVEAFYRVMAADTGRASQVLTYAPLIPAHLPVVVASDGDLVHVHHDGADHLVDTHDGLEDLTELLEHLPIQAGALRHPVLVIDTTTTLRRLAAIASNPHTSTPTAAGLDWLIQRAEHPGSGAAYVLGRDLRRRWATGAHPSARLSLYDWTTGLGLGTSATPARDALALVDLLTSGHTLPGLLDLAGDDSHSWERLGATLQRWRVRDSRAAAALGLLSRAHAAEMYESLALTDPLVADRQIRTGTVVETVVTEADHRAHRITVEAPTALSRHRIGARMQGWAGTTAQADQGVTPALASAVLTDLLVTAHGALRLTLTESVAPARPAVGDLLTLRPKAPDLWQQRRYRATYAAHYRAVGNVFSRRQAVPVTRRPVPLDIVVAAADAE